MKDELGGFLASDAQNPEYIRLNLPARAPEYAPTDEPAKCYRINSTYIGYILAGIDPFSHPDAFVGTLEEREQAAAHFVDLQILLMTGNVSCGEVDEMRLRQNSNNPCQLEQSFDNGTTWELAFDYGLCFAQQQGYDLTIVNNNVAQAIAVSNAVIEDWDGTWQQLAPGMDFDLSVTDELRDEAYCFAVQLLFTQIGLMLGVMEESGWSEWDIVEMVARAVSVGSKVILGYIWFAAKAVNPYFLLATAIASVVSAEIADYISDHEEEIVLTDFLTPETQESLICCSMDVIGGMTPAALRFSQMIDVCEDVNLDPAIASTVAALLGTEQVYAAFILCVQQAFEALQGGQRFNCPCAVEMIVFELTTEAGVEPDTHYGEQTWHGAAFDAGCYVYVPEGGVFFGDEITGDYINYRGVSMSIDGVFGEVRSVEIQGNLALGIGSGSDNAVGIIYGGDRRTWTRAEADVGLDSRHKRTAYRLLDDGTITVVLRSDVRYGTEGTRAGSCMIARVIIRGKDLLIVGVT